MKVPAIIGEFLSGKRIAVAGVSRGNTSAANPIFRKLRAGGYEVYPVNPNATEVEGGSCYPSLSAIPGHLDGVVVATPPEAGLTVVRQALDRGVRRIWFHRSFGTGSVSQDAVDECNKQGVRCIVGGCPLMYCEPVDFAHRCLRGWMSWRGRLPA